jgi:hypothetical protein
VDSSSKVALTAYNTQLTKSSLSMSAILFLITHIKFFNFYFTTENLKLSFNHKMSYHTINDVIENQLEAVNILAASNQQLVNNIYKEIKDKDLLERIFANGADMIIPTGYVLKKDARHERLLKVFIFFMTVASIVFTIVLQFKPLVEDWVIYVSISISSLSTLISIYAIFGDYCCKN